MSADRDQGLTALQGGNAAEAVTLLERATQADPTDYQAFMYLGAAYGQAERHHDAIAALTQAVTLQPANAQGRYNLGIAMERGGYAPQALEAYQQALQLQPDYPKAQEAARRLEGGAAPAPGFAAPTDPQATQYYTPPAQGVAPPAATETPTQYAPQGYAPQPPQYAPPTGQSPQDYGQPTMMPGQPANPYGQPPVYPGGYAPGAYRGVDAYVEDRFDLKQAALDWVQIIRAPKAFFDGQAGRVGFKAPLAFLFFTLLIRSIASVLGAVLKPATLGVTLIGVATNLTLGFAFATLFLLIGALVYHAVGKLFGNQSDVSGSFRAVCYCQAPSLILTVILGLASPLLLPDAASPLGMRLPGKPDILLRQTQNAPNSPFGSPRNSRYNPSGGYSAGSYGGAGTTQKSPLSNPALFGGLMALGVFGILMGLVFFLWNVVLLVIAISSIQQISTGSAVGVVVAVFVVAVALVVIAAVAIGGALVAAMSGSH